MIPAASKTKLTYDDYCLIPDDGKRHEIIDGIHYVSPAPFVPHQRIARRIIASMNDFIETHQLGEVFFAPVDVVFSAFDVVQPDILFISNERASLLTEKNMQGAPDLVIEVLSSSTRRYDEVTKRKLYEQFGVKEYWIVDRELETVKIYRLEEETFLTPALLNRENDDALSTELLPGWRLELSHVFSK